MSRISSHTDNSYLESTYLEFADVKERYYDGLIVTGAPVEKWTLKLWNTGRK